MHARERMKMLSHWSGMKCSSLARGKIDALQERYRALELENKTLRKLFTQPAITPPQEASLGAVQQAPAKPLEERMGALLGL